MNIKLIIMPEPFEGSSVSKKIKGLCNELEKVAEKPVEVMYDIKAVEFDKEDDLTYYLLFCLTPHDYKEVVENSHKLILMNASYPALGNIIRDFNFGGVVCYQHFVKDLPILFGLKSVLKNIDNIQSHPPLIRSEKYDSFFRPNLTTVDVLKEYLQLHNASRGKII